MERLDAIIKTIAPDDTTPELKDLYYYEDLSDIIDTAETNFWKAVKEQLNEE